MLPFYEKKDTELFVYEYKNFGFAAHLHPSLEVVWARRGDIALCVDGTSHILRQGQLGIVFPGKVHSYEYAGEGEGSIFLLSPALLGSYRAFTEGKEPCDCIVKEIDPDAFFALERLRRCMNESLNRQKVYTRLFLCFLFEALTLREETQKRDILPLVVDYMERNFRQKLSLEEVASSLYISKYTLSRVFNTQLKSPFNAYLNSLRVRNVIELMEQGRSISECAYESGFENLRTFNRAFKAAMGMCPSEYKGK
ncbi:MAG: helix-turn-helix domain-containing protein [Clostridia bacterium]|nr:helix-turn-helix domain-containing protein [Clostridia bacterium]